MRALFWFAMALGLCLAATACGDDLTGTSIRIEVPGDGSAPTYGEAGHGGARGGKADEGGW